MGLNVDQYSVAVAICYFGFYLSSLAITSVVCAYHIKKEESSKSCFKFFKLWTKSLWQMKKLYLAVIPHFFDQATDLGVLLKYYALWRNDSDVRCTDCQSTLMNTDQAKYFFFGSICVIMLHKVMSCSSVYLLTRHCMDVMFQFFDLLLIKAIYTNYKLGKTEPSSAQRYLQILEATFESAPQILISLAFILKTQQWDNIVLISIIVSLWTLTSRIMSDDKPIIDEDWQYPEFSYKRCPVLNWRYLFRVLWRFCEVTNKATLYALVWLSIGGFALTVIICFEFMCCICLSIMTDNMIILGNLLYWTIIDSSYLHQKYPTMGKWIQYIAISYRFGSLYMYLVFVTLFATVLKFDAWKVPSFADRKHDVIQNPLGLSLYVYCWITSILWPLCLVYIRNKAVNIKYVGRDVARLIESKQWLEALELLEFVGINVFPEDEKTIKALQHLYGEVMYRHNFAIQDRLNEERLNKELRQDKEMKQQQITDDLDFDVEVKDGAFGKVVDVNDAKAISSYVQVIEVNRANRATLGKIFRKFESEMKVIDDDPYANRKEYNVEATRKKYGLSSQQT